jgi:hypothetical protein
VAPLIVMIVGWVLFRLIGFMGAWEQVDSWSGALRFAFAVMKLFFNVREPRHRLALCEMVA